MRIYNTLNIQYDDIHISSYDKINELLNKLTFSCIVLADTLDKINIVECNITINEEYNPRLNPINSDAEFLYDQNDFLDIYFAYNTRIPYEISSEYGFNNVFLNDIINFAFTKQDLSEESILNGSLDIFLDRMNNEKTSWPKNHDYLQYFNPSEQNKKFIDKNIKKIKNAEKIQLRTIDGMLRFIECNNDNSSLKSNIYTSMSLIKDFCSDPINTTSNKLFEIISNNEIEYNLLDCYFDSNCDEFNNFEYYTALNRCTMYNIQTFMNIFSRKHHSQNFLKKCKSYYCDKKKIKYDQNIDNVNTNDKAVTYLLNININNDDIITIYSSYIMKNKINIICKVVYDALKNESSHNEKLVWYIFESHFDIICNNQLQYGQNIKENITDIGKICAMNKSIFCDKLKNILKPQKYYEKAKKILHEIIDI